MHWKNTQSVPAWLDCSQLFNAWLPSQFQNNFFSRCKHQPTAPPCGAAMVSSVLTVLTVNTLQKLTGCKQKSFTVYDEDVLVQMRTFTLKILLIWSISDFPGKRGFWVRSSPKMQPTDHMSTAVEYSCGEKNKHRGSPQEQSTQSAWHASTFKS